MSITNRLRYGKKICAYVDMFKSIKAGNVVMFYTSTHTEEEVKQNFKTYLNVDINIEKIKDNIFKLTKHEKQKEQQSN